MTVKVLNLESRVNETRFLVYHELCESNCRLNKNACSLKPKWNHAKM